MNVKDIYPIEVFKKAQKIIKNDRVKKVRKKITDDGNMLVRAKVLDNFNFVSHVSLIFDKDELVRQHCTCYAMLNSDEPCEHCAAVASVFLDSPEYTDQISQKKDDFMISEPVDNDIDNYKIIPDELEDQKKDIPISEIDNSDPFDNFFLFENSNDEPSDTDILSENDLKKENLSNILTLDDSDESVPDDRKDMNILFGYNTENNEEIIWHPNDTESVFHFNTGIIGTMGTGKTQFNKSMIAQLYLEQPNNYNNSPLGILIFDYKGDYNETKTDFVKAVNARVLKPCKLPFNPFSLPIGKINIRRLPVHISNAFTDSISKIFGLGVKQKGFLNRCIINAYIKNGIDLDDSRTWTRPAPTMKQVYDVFINSSAGRPDDSLTEAMDKLDLFDIFESDPRKTCSIMELINGVVVIDISNYDPDLQNLVVAITLDNFYSNMQSIGSSKTDGRFRQLSKLILVDEADNFMSCDFNSLKKIMKEGREFGVGVILSTQSLSHFTSNNDNYSRYILTWVVHNTSDLNQRDVEYIFKFEPKSQDIPRIYSTIKSLEKHLSVVKISKKEPVIMRDKPFWELCDELNKKEV